MDGRRISVDPGLRYLALNKPRGVTTTMRDPHAARDLTRLLPSVPACSRSAGWIATRRGSCCSRTTATSPTA